MSPSAARTLGVSIVVDAVTAYRCLSEPLNFPRWASGLATSLRQHDGRWWAETPEGRAEVRFSPANEYGVLDHSVHLPGGQVVHVPLRVVPHGDGCELLLTLFRQPAMTDARFEADVQWVQRDLQAAKTWLEGGVH